MEERTMNEILEVASEAVVTPAGQGTCVDLGGHRVHIPVSSRDTGGTLVMLIADVDYESGVPPHIHAHEDETFHVLSGRFALMVGGRAIEAGPGDTVFAPRKLPHTWRCISPEGGKLLGITTPSANFEAFMLEMAKRGTNPAADMADPVKRAEFIALSEKHGITRMPAVK
jgi:quercetin dioxygenase-like cupin family protein